MIVDVELMPSQDLIIVSFLSPKAKEFVYSMFNPSYYKMNNDVPELELKNDNENINNFIAWLSSWNIRSKKIQG